MTVAESKTELLNWPRYSARPLTGSGSTRPRVFSHLTRTDLLDEDSLTRNSPTRSISDGSFRS